MLTEINFDGLIGPNHNYAGLSLGNLASAKNAGGVSQPRAAALQGIEKMRTNLRLGLVQGLLLPHDRPDGSWLTSLGTTVKNASPALLANALSASAMWAANAATVSPAADTEDGRCHLSVANLMTMPHRSHEWQGTLKQLRCAFAHAAFKIHGPVPAPFGDEGAANHMRLCRTHADSGVEVFVYGAGGGPFPARQHIEASKAIARIHGVNKALFVQQSEAAIAAGAFHNDVVAVANERVLFTHELAFAEKGGFYADLKAVIPEAEIIEVPDAAVSLDDAIKSYLFNAQLVTLADGGMALILPTEAQDNVSVWAWLNSLIASNGPIRQLIPVNVRESMANGGGPACLRLRVVCNPTTVDPRFLMDEAKLDLVARIVTAHWPEQISPTELASPDLWAHCIAARIALFQSLNLAELLSD